MLAGGTLRGTIAASDVLRVGLLWIWCPHPIGLRRDSKLGILLPSDSEDIWRPLAAANVPFVYFIAYV